MEIRLGATPFGCRPMTLGLLASQISAEKVEKDAAVHKWQVFHDIRDAKEHLGVTDRALAILNALLTFYPETGLFGDTDLIVFPSNEQLIIRANGMSPATLRRHLAILVQAGLVIRRDSPNGKRFARKGEGGAIEQAYGFDLAPIVARASEFKRLADAVKQEKKALRVVRERVTICRRDIGKMIDTGRSEEISADWRGFQQRYELIMGHLPRTASHGVLTETAGELEALWVEVRNVLENHLNSQNMNANESHSERHIHNSNPNPPLEIEQASDLLEEAGGEVAKANNVYNLSRREIPLNVVLDACPNIAWLVKGGGGIRTWSDFMIAAETARPVLGISPNAWDEARVIMGAEQAAVTLAGIYERSDQINNAGGYLRSLVGRAKEGKFSTWPMIMALLRAKLKEGKQAS